MYKNREKSERDLELQLNSVILVKTNYLSDKVKLKIGCR